jgi:hypothetical protein
MKGDFSRFTHDETKHYNRVLKQQGRADVDADHNEQAEIAAHLDASRITDVVGRTGFPRDSNAFAITAAPENTDFFIQPGRGYVDGILCELEGTAPIRYSQQPDLPSAPALTTPVAGRRDLVYLDVWERHITALQDPSIKEVALGGADTATRVKVMAQVRVKRDVGAAATCSMRIDADDTDATLTTSLVAADATPDLCSPLPGSSFRGIENRLYRVEIHAGGAPGTATFKWSRDNGAVTYGVAGFPGANRVRVHSLGRDQYLAVAAGQWVEVTADELELDRAPGVLSQVAAPPAANIIELGAGADLSGFASRRNPLLRRWDGTGTVTTSGTVHLEDGVHIRFSGTRFLPGDYWTFTTRTIESGGLQILTAAKPQGVRHHYANLAILTWRSAGGGFAADISHCRETFPPLTDIRATDVSFDSSVCRFPRTATNVQEALDELCKREFEGCEIVVKPGEGWERVFDTIPEHGDATLCFRPGEYLHEQPITVRSKGNLKLTGAGLGTRINIGPGESALTFENCNSVTIRDMFVRAGQTSNSGKSGSRGALTFINCGTVSLSSVVAQCANGLSRSTACVVVQNTARSVQQSAVGIVEIDRCEFRIGHHQVGVLIVNSNRAHITNNRLRARPPKRFTVQEKVQDKRTHAALREVLMKGFSIAQPRPTADAAHAADAIKARSLAPRRTAGGRLAITERPQNVFLTLGNEELRFATQPALADAWQEILRKSLEAGITDKRAVTNLVRRRVDEMILERERNDTPPQFKAVLDEVLRETVQTAAQGITVAGTIARDVLISGNTIEAVAQGIHVGVSHADASRTEHDDAGRVAIHDNSVHVHAAVGAIRSRHAIFVGNCDSLTVRDNYATLRRFTALEDEPIEAIRVFGYFGRYINVRDNHIDALPRGTGKRGGSDRFTVGITVMVRGVPARRPVWRVVENLTAGAETSVLTNSSAVVKTPNWS